MLLFLLLSTVTVAHPASHVAANLQQWVSATPITPAYFFDISHTVNTVDNCNL